jgi:hypothetical protein
MAKKKTELTKSFYVIEATTFHGGFGTYMNNLMEKMEHELVASGVPGPYKWKFAGGDGVTTPVVICAFRTT